MPLFVTRYLLAIVLFGACGPLSAQTTPHDLVTAARRVPESSVLLVFSDNVAASCRQFLQSELGKAVAGPVFAPLRAELAIERQASLLNPEPFCGLAWKDLAEIEAPGVLTILPLADDSAGVALILFTEPTQQGPLAIPDRLRKIAAFHQEAGWRVEESTRDGGGTWLFQPPVQPTGRSNREAKQDQPARAIFWDSGVQGFISHVQLWPLLGDFQPPRSLADAPQFRPFHEAADARVGNTESHRAGDLEFFVRPWHLVLALNENSVRSSNQRELLDPLARAERLGFSQFDTVGGILRLAEDGPADFVLESFVPIPKPLSGLLRSLDFRPGAPPQWPEWVASSARTVQQWNWSFPSAMEGFGAMFDEFTEPGPDGAGLFDDLLMGLRDDPVGPQVDLAGDLFPLLGPAMIAVSHHEMQNERGREAESPDGTSASGLTWLYVSECQDTPRATEILKQFYASDRLVQHDQVGPYHVWTVPAGGSLFVEGESEEIPTIRAMAVGEQRLLFATHPDILQSALSKNPPTKSVAQAESWKGMRSWLHEQWSAETAWMGMTRWDASNQSAYELARSTPRSQADRLDVSAWSWLLFGSWPDDRRPPASAPSASEWQHVLEGRAAQLSLGRAGWYFSWASFPRTSSTGSEKPTGSEQ